MYIIFHRGIVFLYDCVSLWSVVGLTLFVWFLLFLCHYSLYFVYNTFCCIARKHTLVVALLLHLPHYLSCLERVTYIYIYRFTLHMHTAVKWSLETHSNRELICHKTCFNCMLYKYLYIYFSVFLNKCFDYFMRLYIQFIFNI